MNETREKMNYDVVIVGAGPSGLSAGIKIKAMRDITPMPHNGCRARIIQRK